MINLYFISLGIRDHNNNKDGVTYIEKELFIRFKLPTNQYLYLDLSLGFRKKNKKVFK